MRFAPAWRRLVAHLLDVFLTGTISSILHLIFPIPTQLMGWTVFLTFMAYNISMDYWRQATIGKMIMKIKVVNLKGEQISLSTSFYRNFGKIISALPLYWGFIRLLSPQYKQAIHDEIARCYVVEN